MERESHPVEQEVTGFVVTLATQNKRKKWIVSKLHHTEQGC